MNEYEKVNYTAQGKAWNNVFNNYASFSSNGDHYSHLKNMNSMSKTSMMMPYYSQYTMNDSPYSSSMKTMCGPSNNYGWDMFKSNMKHTNYKPKVSGEQYVKIGL